MLRPSFALQIASLLTSSDNAAGGPDRFEILRHMDGSADSLQFELHAPIDIEVGAEVTLDLGHDGDNQRVFTGSVCEISRRLGHLQVLAVGTLEALLSLRVGAAWENQSVGSIVRDLADQAGITTATIDEGPVLSRFYISNRHSAGRQVLELIRSFGLEIYTLADGRLECRAFGEAAALGGGLGGGLAAAAASFLGGGAEVYRYAEHVFSIDGRRSQLPWPEVRVGGESPTSVLGESSSHWLTANDSDYGGSAGSGERTITYIGPLARSQDLAQQMAGGYRISANRSAHRLEAEILGRPSLELGADFSCEAFADEALNQGGYIQSLCHRFASDWGFSTRAAIIVGGGQ